MTKPDYCTNPDAETCEIDAKTKNIIARVSEETHKALKVKLTQEGKSIQGFVAEAVEEYLKEK